MHNDRIEQKMSYQKVIFKHTLLMYKMTYIQIIQSKLKVKIAINDKQYHTIRKTFSQ